MVAIQEHQIIGERFRRIWALVEEIAAQPGQGRGALARRFHLSERQIQTDLRVITHDMRLPLVRRRGYRFAIGKEDAPASSFTLREAQTLGTMLARAKRDITIPLAELDSLSKRLPDVFPPHLQPIVRRTYAAIQLPHLLENQVFLGVSDVLAKGLWAKLTYRHSGKVHGFSTLTIRPEYLIPYLGTWFVVGEEFKDRRIGMYRLSQVVSVGEMTVETETHRRRVEVAS